MAAQIFLSKLDNFVSHMFDKISGILHMAVYCRHGHSLTFSGQPADVNPCFLLLLLFLFVLLSSVVSSVSHISSLSHCGLILA